MTYSASTTMGRSPSPLAVLAACAVLAASARASAASSCQIVSTTGVAFGMYDTYDSMPLDSVGDISVQCFDVVPADRVRIELSRGKGSSFVPRVMQGHGSRLIYNLYLDAARTVVWGNGGAGSSLFSTRPLNGQVMSIPVYGRLPPRQNVKPGLYQDIIIVTLVY